MQRFLVGLLFLSALLSLPALGAPASLRIAIPAQRSAEHRAPGWNFGRDIVIYALDYFVDPAATLTISADAVEVPTDAIWPAALPDFATMASLPDGAAVLQYVLRILLRGDLYNAARTDAGHHVPLPDNRRDLAQKLTLLRSGDGGLVRDWDLDSPHCRRRMRNPSAVKAAARMLWRCKIPGLPSFAMAFTLSVRHFDSRDAHANPVVREVELIFGGSSGTSVADFDFYAYGPDGMIDNTSSFVSGASMTRAATPHACMACHYDATKRRFGFAPKGWQSAAGAWR